MWTVGRSLSGDMIDLGEVKCSLFGKELTFPNSLMQMTCIKTTESGGRMVWSLDVLIVWQILCFYKKKMTTVKFYIPLWCASGAKLIILKGFTVKKR